MTFTHRRRTIAERVLVFAPEPVREPAPMPTSKPAERASQPLPAHGWRHKPRD